MDKLYKASISCAKHTVNHKINSPSTQAITNPHKTESKSHRARLYARCIHTMHQNTPGPKVHLPRIYTNSTSSSPDQIEIEGSSRLSEEMNPYSFRSRLQALVLDNNRESQALLPRNPDYASPCVDKPDRLEVFFLLLLFFFSPCHIHASIAISDTYPISPPVSCCVDRMLCRKRRIHVT